MIINTQVLTPLELKSAIVRDPLIVKPDTTVMAAISLMSGVRAICDSTKNVDGQLEELYLKDRSSCVLVVEDQKLLGIFTERDIVRLSAKQRSLEQITMAEVMISPVICLQESALTDLFSAISLLQQHDICHLPILDDQNQMVGIITKESLLQALDPQKLSRQVALSEQKQEQPDPLQECRQAQEALRRSEAHQQALMKAIPDLMMRIDRQGIILDFIPNSYDFCIINEDSEMRGNSIFNNLPYELAQKRLEYMQIALDTNSIQIYEQELLINDKICTEEVRIVPYDEDEVLVLIRDISEQQTALRERNQAEAALIQSEAQSRAILEAIPDFMFRMGADGVYRGFVTADREVNIFTKDFDPTGSSMAEVLPPEIANRHLYYLEQALSTGKLQVYEQQTPIGNRLQDEEVRVIKSSEDEALFMIRDISDRATAVRELKQAEQKLLQLNQELEIKVSERTQELSQVSSLQQAILNGADYSIISTDIKGVIQTFNAAAERMLGYDATEVIGKLTPEIIHDRQEVIDRAAALSAELGQEIPPGFEVLVAQARQGIISEAEWTYIRKDGTRFPVALSVTDLKDRQQQIIGFLGIARDITQRKMLQEKLVYSENKMRSIFESITDIILTISLQGQEIQSIDIPSVSSSFTNSRYTEIVDQTINNFLQYSSDNDWRQRVSEILASGQANQFDYALSVGADLLWFSTVISPINATTVTWVARDISDRKRAEAELQKLSERLTVSLKSGAIGCWEWDIIHNITLWDERMYELYGVTKANNDSVVYDIWAKGLHPEDLISTETLLQQALLGQAEYDVEFRVVHPDGSIHFLKAYGVLVKDCQGNPQSMIGINFDITDRKQAEQENQNLRERLQFVMATSPAVIFTCKAEGDYGATFMSENVYEVTGYTPAEVLAESSFWVDHIHPDDAAQVFAELPQLSERGTHSHEYRFQDRDGYYLWIRDELRLVRDEQGNPKEIVGYFADITDRKQTELKLQQQAKQERLLGDITQQMRSSLNLQDILKATINELHQVLDSDRVFVYRLSLDGTGAAIAEAVSPEFLSVLNVTFPEEIFLADRDDRYSQGKVSILTDREDPNQLRSPTVVEFLTKIQVRARLVVPIIQNQTLWGLLIAHQCDRPRSWQEWEVNLLKQTANQLAIAIQQSSLFEQLQQQLLERQQAENQLTQTNQQLAISNEELARATRLKDEFLANMSHELRTPLNAILGMTEGLEDEVFGSVNQQQIKALKTIERSGSHLLELINDILDVAKIESGQVELECMAVEVASLCQSSMAFIKQQALKKGIQFATKLPQYLPDLSVDERRIRQVLINLLNNAVKFTPEGGRISLEVTQLPPRVALENESPQNFLKIAVIDTGIGISPENIQKLFQPFMQIDSALNRQYNGTGLGLALVKRIVELHGGRVGLTSELGVGSCFSIELPCIYNPSQPIISSDELVTTTSEVSPIVKQSPLILLAENNEANINTFSGYLRAKGYRIMVAKSGQEAIDLAKAHQPEIILLDMQMSGMDELEAIEQIRLDPSLVTTPIIGLTASAMMADQTKCLESGANVYLAKPVKLTQLTTTIQKLLEGEVESSNS